MRRRGGALAALAALAPALMLGACNGDDEGDSTGPADDGRSGECTTDAQMDVYSAPGVVHTDAPGYAGPLPTPNPTYTVNPPSGGDHLSRAVPTGVFAGLNVPPDGQVVHALEHGYVVIWYRPDLPVAQITLIRDVRTEYARDAIVVERKDMPVPVAATAWKQRLLCREADADDLGKFIETARNKAPEKVPH